MPDPDDLLQDAIAAHRAGRLDEAMAQYRRVLSARPGDVEAMQLLGAVLLRRGPVTEALAWLDKAVARDPEHGPAQLNRGVALRNLGRYDEAESAVLKALAVRPAWPEASIELGRIRLLGGRPKEAIEALRTALPRVDAAKLLAAALLDADRPRDAEMVLKGLVEAGTADDTVRTHLAEALRRQGRLDAAEAAAIGAKGGAAGVVLARVARDRGDLDEAVRRYERAVASSPDHLEGWLGLGNARRATGDVAGAEAAWRKAVAMPEAAHNLGDLLCRTGRHTEGLPLLAAAAPRLAYGWVSLADAVATAPELPPEVEALLPALLEQDGVDHQQLERAVRTVLERIPGVRDAVEHLLDPEGDPELAPLDEATEDAVLAHPLLVPWLRRTIVRHPGWEEVLRAVRKRLLKDVARRQGARWMPVLEAFAEQGWNNEYAWWGSHEGRATRAVLEADVADRLGREPMDDELAAGVTAIAMYTSIRDIEGAPGLVGSLDWQKGPLAALLRQQVMEPLEEVRLAAEIPVLAMSDDATSRAVREMYEENPYPRLVSLHRKPPEPLPSVLRQLFPRFQVAGAKGGASAGGSSGGWDKPEILVAGCGTGQQAIAAATRYAGAKVLAVDLSRRSLGAAARRAQAWGLQNLELAQADILALGGLGRRFHLVEAGGVLHHMADPMAGWRILASLVQPGGLMKIGLYSERSRAPVLVARDLVADRGFPPTRAGLRRARRAFLGLPEGHPARPIVWSPDFYSLSGFRDLAFHVMEHRFTLPQLDGALRELGLELVGFQHARPEAVRWYRERWPDDDVMTDLSRWDEVEREHPEVFAGMYQFWCRKPA